MVVWGLRWLAGAGFWGCVWSYSRKRMPALWIRVLPAQRRDVSRSAGRPSDWLGLIASCSVVARGLERSETMGCC